MAQNFCNFNPLTDWLAQSRLEFYRSNFSNPLRNPSRNFSLYSYSTKFIGLIPYFSTKLNKLWKTIKKELIFVYFQGFSRVFQSRMKSSGSYQKFVFLEVFCFFWHLYWQEVRRNSGWNEFWTKIRPMKI